MYMHQCESVRLMLFIDECRDSNRDGRNSNSCGEDEIRLEK